MTHFKEKFTAGEWSVLRPDSTRPSQIIVYGGVSGGVTIYNAPLTNETEANAHLISAAPDMFSALESAEDALVWYGEENAVAKGALVYIRNAMAKARGEEVSHG